MRFCLKVSRVQPSMNCRHSRMLSRISKRARRARTESINRVTLRAGTNLRLQVGTVGDIDPGRKQILKIVFDADILEQVDIRLGCDLDHDVDVAVRALVATRVRSEQGRMRDAALTQGALVFPQPVDDLLPVHGASLSTKPHGNQRLGAALTCPQPAPETLRRAPRGSPAGRRAR